MEHRSDITDRIDLLNAVADILQNEEDFPCALTAVLELLSRQMDVERGMITILNRHRGEILLEAAHGLSDEERERARYSPGEGITGRVVESGRPIIVSSIVAHPDFLNRTGLRIDKDMAFLCVPIGWYRDVIGALSVIHQPAVEEHLKQDVEVLRIVSGMICQKVGLHRAIHEENQALVEENSRLRDELKLRFGPSNIIGNSPGMRDAYALVDKVSRVPTSVLLLGESGVGKELFAHAIHFGSPRATEPFVRVNCGALPSNLIESELFGHEKGAFTGAITTRSGRFESANRGSLFLDEIGEIGMDVQTKLLRVLQEKEFERVGSSHSIRVDVRIIAATNRDLSQMVKEGTFREDLFYRLNVFPITVPPLRERKTDIPQLINHFVEKYSREMGKLITRVSTPAIDLMMSYHWPGNVRELENCIERAVIMSEEGVIRGTHLPPTLQTALPGRDLTRGLLQSRLDAIEYEIIMEEIKRCNGNMSRAARVLGLTNRIMGMRVKKYGIEIRNYKNVAS